MKVNIVELLNEYVEHNKLSNSDIGKKYKVGDSSVSNWRQGHSTPPIELINEIITHHLGIIFCPTCKGDGYIFKKQEEGENETK